MSVKTPISSLQEFCQQNGKNPQYDLIAIEGRAHQPQFVYRCTVGDVSKQGQGGSKKTAKHNAAETMLVFMQSNLSESQEQRDESNTDTSQPNSTADTELNAGHDGSNPVGTLQELVVAKGWRLPIYSLHAESGPAHKKEFIMKCSVETFSVTGSGTAKKVAKRRAANAMYQKLLNLPPDIKPFLEADLNKKTISFDELKNSSGGLITKIESDNLSYINNCETLHQLTDSIGFHTTYYDINMKSNNGYYQCMLLLTTEPRIVVHGIANSVDECHADAARNAVTMLNIFAKESNQAIS